MSTHEKHTASESEAADGRQMLGFEDALMVEGEPIWERMGKISNFCVELVEKHFGERLDFTPESIALLDRVIVSGWGTVPPDYLKNVPVNVKVTFGAYLGEILVRGTSGRWVSGFSDERPATILFLDRDDKVLAEVSPFSLVTEKFERMYRFDLAMAWAALEQKLREAGAR